MKTTATGAPGGLPGRGRRIEARILLARGHPGKRGGIRKCPDLKDPQAILKASFGLKGDMEGKVKAALSASAELQGLAAVIEADVVGACSGLAKDLGATDADLKTDDSGPGKKAEHACNVAVKFLGTAKAEAKAAGALTVKVTPPVCSASMSATADCAASCDVSASGAVSYAAENGREMVTLPAGSC